MLDDIGLMGIAVEVSAGAPEGQLQSNAQPAEILPCEPLRGRRMGQIERDDRQAAGQSAAQDAGLSLVILPMKTSGTLIQLAQ